MIATFIYIAVTIPTIQGDFIVRFSGNSNSYGSPNVLYLTPAIILGTNLLMSLVIHLGSENMFNTGFKVNPERKYIVLADFTLMIMLIELELAIYTLLLTIVWIKQSSAGIVFFSMGLMIPLFITIAVCYVMALKHNK